MAAFGDRSPDLRDRYIQLLVKMLGTPKKCGNISIVMKKFKIHCEMQVSRRGSSRCREHVKLTLFLAQFTVESTAQ
ncbi:LOW QUALITY PROTEIN: hypothetical protein V1478_010401 [Vespula squamosa]|uniref:Uncharacterized protein n=1 Tax=Vespula squamosa TaxID=30214 RepID=A0ABD2AHY0_VESSQ